MYPDASGFFFLAAKERASRSIWGQTRFVSYIFDIASLPRYFVKDVPLHIILRGNNREPIFGHNEDCRFFKDALLDAEKRHELAIHADEGDKLSSGDLNKSFP